MKAESKRHTLWAVRAKWRGSGPYSGKRQAPFLVGRYWFPDYTGHRLAALPTAVWGTREAAREQIRAHRSSVHTLTPVKVRVTVEEL